MATRWVYVQHQGQVWRVAERTWGQFLRDVEAKGWAAVPLADYARDAFRIDYTLSDCPSAEELGRLVSGR